MELSSQRLILRPYCEADISQQVDAVRESMESVGKWLPWCQESYNEEDAKTWFHLCEKNLNLGLSYDLGVFCRHTGELFGSVALTGLVKANNLASVGYWVKHTKQGDGIAVEAVQTLVKFAFEDLALTRLEIIAAEGNTASRRVAEKCDALLECIARNRIMLDGQPSKAAVYSLIPA